MKRLFGLLLSVAALGAPMAVAQQTAKSALSSLARERGWVVARQAVLIAGERGQNQPLSWRVVAPDREFHGRWREYIVQNGHVIEEQALAPEDSVRDAGTPLVQKRVHVDSSQVFAVADQAAKKALVGFDSLAYELRNKELSQEPIWSVRLNDQVGEVVGELVVAADSGVILRRTWFEHGRNPVDADPSVAGRATVRQRRVAAAPGSHARVETVDTHHSGGVREQAHIVWERTRDGIQQGHEVIRSNVRRASDGLRGLFGRAPSHRSDAEWEHGVYDQWE